MIQVFSNSWALFLGIGMLMVGNSLQGSLLGVRGNLEAFDPTLMGYVMSAYFAGFLGGSWMAPQMIRRVGYVRVFAALASLISAAFLIYAVFVTPIAWALMRFVVGFCFSGVYVVAESWLNNSASNENRGQTLSAYMMVQMVGIVIGQAVLNIADPSGYDLFVLMSIVVSLSFAPILLSASPAPLSDNTERMTLRELYESSPLGCVGSFLLGGIFSSMFGMSAVYGAQIGFGVDKIAFFVSLMYVTALIFQYPIGWISDRVDRRRVIAICMIAATLATGMGSIFSENVLFIYLAAAVLGGMANPLYSLLIAHTNDYLPPSKMASASSGLVFINGVGATFGPIVVGYMMGWFGPDGYFIFNCVLSALIAAYAVFRMTQRAALPAADNGTFVALPTRGAVIAEVAAELYAQEAIEERDEDAYEEFIEGDGSADGGSSDSDKSP